MIKTLRTIFKQDKEKFRIPRSVQQVIPIQAVWADGVFQVGRNKFTRTYKFMDINYAVASREDQEAMFLEYSELLNSFDSGATTKITINNRRLNRQDFEKGNPDPNAGRWIGCVPGRIQRNVVGEGNGFQSNGTGKVCDGIGV